MTKLWKASLGWGLLLWLIGYVLGIIVFMMKVPTAWVGWIVSPFGILITLWVLIKKINFEKLASYIYLGIIWAIIAIVLDYFLFVKLFNPADGYYKLDVYIYYATTLLLPIIVGYFKTKKNKE